MLLSFIASALEGESSFLVKQQQIKHHCVLVVCVLVW